MTHLDLFSGIGGFALAASRTWENHDPAFCEIDPFCRKVLAKHWPDATIHEDIRELDGTKYHGIDLLTGGFPCQPFSSAGARKGTDDDRHLWPEMLRVIREASPRIIVGENVPGILNWSAGMVFDSVCSELEDSGYEVQPIVLPASAVNAPHRRDRVWFVAHARSAGLSGSGFGWRNDEEGREVQNGRDAERGSTRPSWNDGEGWEAWPVTHSDGLGFAGKSRSRVSISDENGIAAASERGRDGLQSWTSGDGAPAPHASGDSGREFDGDAETVFTNSHDEAGAMRRISHAREGESFSRSAQRKSRRRFERILRRVDDGVPTWLDRYSRDRTHRLKGLGNAIVPQVAEMIFRSL